MSCKGYRPVWLMIQRFSEGCARVLAGRAGSARAWHRRALTIRLCPRGRAPHPSETPRAKLSAGELLPLFRLAAVNRAEKLGPGDYKQRRNLALIFFRSAACQKCRELLREMAAHYGEYEQLETEVLALSADESTRLRQLARELSLPFPVLADSEGSITGRYLRQTAVAAVFIADRWGAIFTRKIAAQEHDLPAETELREWLEFIELQCEECFPAEWPHTEK